VEHSPTTAALLASAEWRAVRLALAGHDDLVQSPIEGNCIEALRKPLGVVEGVSDVPWHRDCNFGRHAYQCAGVVAGISVDAGNNESGMLRVVAGSHRIGMPAYRANLDPYLPIIPVATDRGDVTIHQTCTLHEATPPLQRERRVMYTGFGLPLRSEVRPDPVQQHQLKELREHAHLLTSQPRSPVAVTTDANP
jgi:Phytanoyl-CoA dioxygenase (PhyH)